MGLKKGALRKNETGTAKRFFGYTGESPHHPGLIAEKEQLN